jgi:GntR family transcriptional regulator, arabinose operon transcriptional repressor
MSHDEKPGVSDAANGNPPDPPASPEERNGASQTTPLYERIKQELKEEIELKDLPPNTPFLSENEAIERFKVSRITVRHAFEILEQEGYIYRVQGKGSFVGPRSARPTKTVAFIATCIMNSGVENVLLRSIEDFLDRNNYNLIVCNNNNDFDKTENYLKRLIRNNIDGVIYVALISETEYQRNSELVQFALNSSVPVVMVDRYCESLQTRIHCVTPDNYGGAYRLTKHLIELGHRRIGVLRGQWCSSAHERLDGIIAALAEHQVQIEPDYIKSNELPNDFGIIAMQYARMRDRPTAIFALNDYLAIELIKALQGYGISVPDEMAVVGFDDFPAGKSPIPLTTVRVPLWDEGQVTASLMVDMLRGREMEPAMVRVPVQLVVRESCGIKHLARFAGRAETVA